MMTETRPTDSDQSFPPPQPLEPPPQRPSLAQSLLAKFRQIPFAEIGAAIKFHRRRIVLGVLVATTAGLGLIGLDHVVGDVMHDRRQGELAADLRKSRETIARGEALSVLQIPSLKFNEVVVEGDAPELLRGGPGHRSSSPLPGEIGNSLIFAHRTRYGGSFSAIEKLQVGDEIVVQSKNGPVFSFRVSEVKKVSSSETDVLADTADPRLTLVTSGPGWLPSERVVVVATATGNPIAQADPSATTSSPKADEFGFNGDRGSSFMNATMLMAYLAALSLWMSRNVLAAFSVKVRLLIATPAAIAVIFCVLINADRILPLTR
jgi:sortase A